MLLDSCRLSGAAGAAAGNAPEELDQEDGVERVEADSLMEKGSAGEAHRDRISLPDKDGGSRRWGVQRASGNCRRGLQSGAKRSFEPAATTFGGLHCASATACRKDFRHARSVAARPLGGRGSRACRATSPQRSRHPVHQGEQEDGCDAGPSGAPHDGNSMRRFSRRRHTCVRGARIRWGWCEPTLEDGALLKWVRPALGGRVTCSRLPGCGPTGIGFEPCRAAGSVDRNLLRLGRLHGRNGDVDLQHAIGELGRDLVEVRLER
jgi:hypothetical protein